MAGRHSQHHGPIKYLILAKVLTFGYHSEKLETFALMARAKISKVRGKTAITLPDDLAKRFKLLPGATIYVRETSRSLEISGLSPADDNDMRNAQETIRQYKENWRYAGG